MAETKEIKSAEQNNATLIFNAWTCGNILSKKRNRVRFSNLSTDPLYFSDFVERSKRL
jgi:hypothetical protein